MSGVQVEQWRIAVDVGMGFSWYLQALDSGDLVVTPCKGLATHFYTEESYKHYLQRLHSWTRIHPSLIRVEKVYG